MPNPQEDSDIVLKLLFIYYKMRICLLKYMFKLEFKALGN